jgi:hypothetical protein
MEMVFRLVVAILSICSIIAMPANTAEVMEFEEIRNSLQSEVADLVTVISRLEALQLLMERSAVANQNYNEQKNIFLSSTLAITTVIAVCQSEADQLTLFLDLRETNRQKFYDIRIQSLEASLRQLGNMERQILVNHSIFPSEFFGQPLFEIQQQALSDARAALKNCKDLLQPIQEK